MPGPFFIYLEELFFKSFNIALKKQDILLEALKYFDRDKVYLDMPDPVKSTLQEIEGRIDAPGRPQSQQFLGAKFLERVRFFARPLFRLRVSAYPIPLSEP